MASQAYSSQSGVSGIETIKAIALLQNERSHDIICRVCCRAAQRTILAFRCVRTFRP
ncbi:hypothetical protein ACE1AT_17580 [Pelatocladus sp. BLCC-F211]|uniref:hypothetical protein n=1 Tax=Pelatocladus sp. BLCC-F211 TaxID=3342752 RepID=UPI0035B970B2